MSTLHQRTAARAAARARTALRDDLERALADAGMRASELARASGVDAGFVSRLRAGKAEASIDTWARLAAPLGLDLSMRLYPTTGPVVRDRFAAPMLELLLRDLHPRWARWTEVSVSRPSRGWIDAVLHDGAAPILLASELQSELRRLEQLVRWHGAKAAALPSWEGWEPLGGPPVSRLLLARRTRATRQVASEFSRQLRVAYPAHPDDAVASLTGAHPWPGAAVAWMTVERGSARWTSGR